MKSQISEGGIPYSYSITSLKTTTSLPHVDLKNIDIQKLLDEDVVNPSPFRYAIFEDTVINIKQYGKSDVIPGKGRIWRIKIGSENAKSIQIIFRRFVLPEGARLFLYDDNQSLIAGAFTKNNLQKDSTLVLADFKGNHVIIEYFEPDGPEYEGKILIGSIARAYKDILTAQSEADYTNVNCPIGKDAQLEKHAVCKMTFKSGVYSYLCSGALINNVRQDGTPYFLTANHCISDSAEASTLVTYFNYENTGCNGDALTAKTLTGAKLLSTAIPSDYSLLKLNNTPTGAFQPYYAGWDANDSATNMVTCVHHPEGFTKKLSIDYDSIYPNPTSVSWEGNTVSPDSSHWVVGFDVGITGGGSSGSPLFNSNYQIIGQLHGGDNTMDLYGKLSYSYAHKPTRYAAIGDFLDPDHTGVKLLSGYSPAGNPPDAFFVTPSDQVCRNAPISFHDYSVFGPYDRTWSITPSGFAFLDGTSESSANPVIAFSNDITYTVNLDLKVSGITKSTESKTIKAGNTLNILVNSKPVNKICDCDFGQVKLLASGAQDYSWSILTKDLDKITLNKNTGDTVIVTRLSSFHADSSFKVNLAVIGTQGSCADTSQFVYNIIKPANDNIAFAKLIKYGKSSQFNNICASIEEGEPVPPCISCTSQYSWCDEYSTCENIVENSVWFKFVASSTGRLSISSSGFDDQIAVYDAESYSSILAGNYTLLAANDDRAARDYNPLIKSVIVTPGKTYWIQLDGSGGGLEGIFTLTLVELIQTSNTEPQSSIMMVYPQPANNLVFLNGIASTKSSVNLSVYSVSGSIMITRNVAVNQGEIVLDISSWESGIYIARINSEDISYVARIVKY